MKGVYFSANDRVLPWATAFLNSFRDLHPEVDLYLIPFNEEVTGLLRLSEKYDFKVFDDQESFARLEAIGDAFELGHSPGVGRYWFRRYAAFWGPLDEFLYLDVRQVVLGDLSSFTVAPLTYGLDLVHYDVAVEQVYEPGPLRTSLLCQGRGRGFNSGRWASRKGVFNLEEFEHLAEEAIKVRDQLNPRNTDQAFINYCCDAKGLRTGHIAELLGGVASLGWAGQRGRPFQDQAGVWRLWDFGGLDHKKKLLLMHWAGFPLASWIPHYGLLRKFGAVPRGAGWQGRPIGRFVRALRGNRFINEMFHRLRCR